MISHGISLLLMVFPVTVQSVNEKEVDCDLDAIQMSGCDFWTYGPKIKEICEKIKETPAPYLPRIKSRLSLPDDDQSLLSRTFEMKHAAFLRLLGYINSDESKSIIRETFKSYMPRIIRIRNKMEEINNASSEAERAGFNDLRKSESILLLMRCSALTRLIIVKDNGLIDYCIENLEKEDHGTISKMIDYLYAVPQTESERAKVLTSLERMFADPQGKLYNSLSLERIIAKMKAEWTESRGRENDLFQRLDNDEAFGRVQGRLVESRV